MRPRPLYLSLLCLVLFALSCSDAEHPTQPVTSPHDALLRGGAAALNNCPFANFASTALLVEDGSFGTNVVPNDDDVADLDNLVVRITAGPEHGTAVALAPDWIIRYTPDKDYCGPDSLQFVVDDGTCASEPYSIRYTVACINDCPTGASDNISVMQGSSVTFQLEGEDTDDADLQYEGIQGPAHGTVVIGTSTGSGAYTPADGYSGSDSFTYRLYDGECYSPEYSITVTVNTPVTDADADGVPDAEDNCDDSNTNDTVSIDGCDSGVANPVDDNGCSLADKVAAEVAVASQAARNHGQFVSAMARRLNSMVADGTITAGQKGALMRCMGSSSHGR